MNWRCLMDNLQTIDSYNKIILDNEWLIYKIINKYTSHLELEDLYQVASIGLIKAYKSFKDDYNTKFSSYAYKYVLGEVIKYVNQYRSIKVNKEPSPFRVGPPPLYLVALSWIGIGSHTTDV